MPEVDADKKTMESICAFINEKTQNPNVSQIKIIYDHASPTIQGDWKDSWLTESRDKDNKERFVITVRLKREIKWPNLISLELFRQNETHWRVTKGIYPKSGAIELNVYFDEKMIVCEFEDDEITAKTEDYEKNREPGDGKREF